MYSFCVCLFIYSDNNANPAYFTELWLLNERKGMEEMNKLSATQI